MKRVDNVIIDTNCACTCTQLGDQCNAFKFDSETKSCHLAYINRTFKALANIPEDGLEKFYIDTKKFQDKHCKNPYLKEDPELICNERDFCELQGMNQCSHDSVESKTLTKIF